MKFRLEFRGTIEDIFSELSKTIGKGSISSKSAGAADIVSLGDSWVNFAISEKLIEPIQGVDDQDWFHTLSDKWKVRYIDSHCRIFLLHSSVFFKVICDSILKCRIIFTVNILILVD